MAFVFTYHALRVGTVSDCADIYLPVGGILTKKPSIHVSVYDKQAGKQTNKQTNQPIMYLAKISFDSHPPKANSYPSQPIIIPINRDMQLYRGRAGGADIRMVQAFAKRQIKSPALVPDSRTNTVLL